MNLVERGGEVEGRGEGNLGEMKAGEVVYVMYFMRE